MKKMSVQVAGKTVDFDDVLNYVKEITEGQGMKTKYVVEGDEVVVSLTD